LKNAHFFEFKKGGNFNHSDGKSIGTGIQTLSILRINPPMFGSGLKFEPEAEIGQKEGS